MSADLQGAISSAISAANDKAAQKSEGGFTEQVAKDRVSSANSRISVAESKVTRNQGEMAKLDEQLNPPPTKDVDTGGKSGGTKTVVDTEEVRRLNSKKSGIQQALVQAQEEVKTAQSAAETAASAAITQAGINSETQSEMDSLMSKANNIKNTLSEGGSVDDKDIKALVDGFNKTAGGLTQEQNKAGILSEAFYEPMAKALKDIGNLLKTPVTTNTGDANGDGVNEANLPQANKELNDVGITDLEKQNTFIDFATRISDFEKGLIENGNKFGGEFTQEKFTTLSKEHTDMTAGLTDQQKGTGVIKESSEVIGRINAAAGAGG
jgi:hypothetical protein